MPTSNPGRPDGQTSRPADIGQPAVAYGADTSGADTPVPRELREGASIGHPEGLVSPEVRSDADGPLRGTGLAADRDSGAGASAGHDTGGEEASRHAQAALRERADRALQRGSELAATARERLQRWQQMDAERDSFPGEHWLTFGAGLYLLTRRRASFLGQLFTVAAGAALVYRSMTGRDSLTHTFRAQADRLGAALQQGGGGNEGQTADEAAVMSPADRQERSSQLPM